jgi:hypothetical protein
MGRLLPQAAPATLPRFACRHPLRPQGDNLRAIFCLSLPPWAYSFSKQVINPKAALPDALGD